MFESVEIELEKSCLLIFTSYLDGFMRHLLPILYYFVFLRWKVKMILFKFSQVKNLHVQGCGIIDTGDVQQCFW